MRRKRLYFFLVAIPLVSAAGAVGVRSAWDQWADKTPILDCVRTVNLGERDLGEIAAGRFQIKNSGRGKLEIDHFQTTCSCSDVEHEVEGQLRRIQSVRLSPGEQVELVVRVAVGARPGQSQSVQVFFKTNDPAQPVGSIYVIVPRVKGTVYTEPYAALFGTLPLGAPAKQVINVYDNGVSGRRIHQVRSTYPERFTVRLLPLQGEELQQVHEIAGALIARLEVIAQTQKPGRLDGEVEVYVANAPPTPARIPVLGKIVCCIEAHPDVLVLPRHVGERLVYSGQILLSNPDGKSINVEVISAPPGVSVNVRAVADRRDQRWLMVECQRGDSDKGSASWEARIGLRARCGSEETMFQIPILLAGNPS